MRTHFLSRHRQETLSFTTKRIIIFLTPRSPLYLLNNECEQSQARDPNRSAQKGINSPPTSTYAEPLLIRESFPRRPSLATPESSLGSASGSSSQVQQWEKRTDHMGFASDLEHLATTLEDGSSIVISNNGRSTYLAFAPLPLPIGRPVTPNTGLAPSRSSILVGDGRGSSALRKGKKRSPLHAQSSSGPRSRRG